MDFLVYVAVLWSNAPVTDSRNVEKYGDQLAQIFTQIGLSFFYTANAN